MPHALMHRWIRSLRPAAVAICTVALSTAATVWAGEGDEDPEATEETAPPRTLSATLTGTALSDYEAGRVLYADGDHAGALLKFRDAYEASKDARLLWNMAACEKNLRRYARVLQLIDRYLAEGGSLLTAEDRADAERLLAAIRPFVAELRLTVNEAGALVEVDGERLGTTPLDAPLLVDMGEREIRVTKAGFAPFIQKGNVTGGTKVELRVDLQALPKVGTLSVLAGPQDAISVDGKPVGVGQWTGDLPPGAHRVRVTAKGMQPYDSQVVVDLAQKSTLRVKLDPVPAAPLVQESDSTWIWVTSGVALAIGLGVGGYLLLRPEDKEAPAPQDGTIPPGHVTLPLW